MLNSQTWPASILFVSICFLHDLLGRVPAGAAAMREQEDPRSAMAELVSEVLRCCKTLVLHCGVARNDETTSLITFKWATFAVSCVSCHSSHAPKRASLTECSIAPGLYLVLRRLCCGFSTLSHASSCVIDEAQGMVCNRQT